MRTICILISIYICDCGSHLTLTGCEVESICTGTYHRRTACPLCVSTDDLNKQLLSLKNFEVLTKTNPYSFVNC